MRRYLADLVDAGYHVESRRDGQYVRFSLPPEKAPPRIPFDVDEVWALTAAAVTSPLFASADCHARVESALSKVQASYPENLRAYVGRFKESFAHTSPPARRSRFLHVVRVLQEQVTERCRVQLVYEDLEGKKTERKVDPYVLWLHRDNIYLVAHCHLRSAKRTFHLDRAARLRPNGIDERSLASPVSCEVRVAAGGLSGA